MNDESFNSSFIIQINNFLLPTHYTVMKTEYITLDFDIALSCGHSILIAGVDEVGRGSLFGPVVAAAVILPPSALPELVAAQIRDSKKLSSDRRRKLAVKICQVAKDWKIGFASTAESDRINILQASL